MAQRQFLRALFSIVFLPRGRHRHRGVIIALDEDAEPADPDFSWFRARYG